MMKKMGQPIVILMADDDADEAGHAEEGHEAKVGARDGEPQHHAHQAKGDGGEDDEGLEEVGELPDQHQEDQRHGGLQRDLVRPQVPVGAPAPLPLARRIICNNRLMEHRCQVC